MADPYQALFAGRANQGLPTKVFVGTGNGIRTYIRLANGEIERTIEESHLVPSSPFKMSTIYILPNPTAEYETRPFDAEVAPEDFCNALVAFDDRHGIQSLEVFAAHPNGANPLTPQLLPSQLFTQDRGDFTVWCTFNLLDGNASKTMKI